MLILEIDRSWKSAINEIIQGIKVNASNALSQSLITTSLVQFELQPISDPIGLFLLPRSRKIVKKIDPILNVIYLCVTQEEHLFTRSL